MLLLTTVNPAFNKGTLKKMLRFGVGGAGGGEGGGEEDVEKVGRTSGKILTTHLLKPETEQQESGRNVLSYHLSGVVLSRKR